MNNWTCTDNKMITKAIVWTSPVQLTVCAVTLAAVPLQELYDDLLFYILWHQNYKHLFLGFQTLRNILI